MAKTPQIVKGADLSEHIGKYIGLCGLCTKGLKIAARIKDIQDAESHYPHMIVEYISDVSALGYSKMGSHGFDPDSDIMVYDDDTLLNLLASRWTVPSPPSAR